MEIYGPGQIHGTQSVRPAQQLKATQTESMVDNNLPVDQVDISVETDFVNQINDLPDVRADRVADIRSQLEVGTYETDEKLDVAIGRLLDEIG